MANQKGHADRNSAKKAFQELSRNFDPCGVVFSSKFPMPPFFFSLEYGKIFKEEKAIVVEKTLDCMAVGHTGSWEASPDILQIESGRFPISEKCFMIRLFSQGLYSGLGNDRQDIYKKIAFE